jgi:4-amino-4-deoxy-L-arabinose transferase-like glycosyltransferase
MNVSRPWLALVVALFCLPLFVDLGRADVQDDEAIYSFGVDRVLESGDWLAPKSSPHEDAAFLEKPPLKFWIVALPIQLGLFAHHEFGLRFWDALFGAIAFGYVFALGCRLAGPLCGAVAVLVLFVHWPLLFEHGLRTNNMEAPLFLCYCGGVFHFLEWARTHPPGGPVRHAVAVGLYFVLGFMTKFVAALFLPATLATGSLLLPDVRRKLLHRWTDWAKVAALVVILCAPWFVYAQWRFGSELWAIILGEHVYKRFSSYLDPDHLQPWHFYWSTIWSRLEDSGAHLLVAAGGVALIVQTIRKRWLDGVVVLSWLFMPVVLISMGTSKIYHYSYPFLPPLALAAGYLPGLVLMLGPARIAAVGRRVSGYATARWPAFVALLTRPTARRTFLAIAAAALLVAVVGVAYGPVRLRVGSTDVFKSSGTFRPALGVLLFGTLAGARRSAAAVAIVLVVAALLPVEAYHRTWARLRADRSPKRDALECIQRVAAAHGTAARGIYLDLPDKAIGHPLYYYFRRLRPWKRPPAPAPAELSRYLDDPAEQRPILTWGETYQAFRSASPSADTIPMVKFTDDVLLLLPGPYAVCSADAAGSTRSN